MTGKLDPNVCRQCFKKVGNSNSTCCSTRNVWHDLRFPGFDKEEFLKHTKNNNLCWECPKCVVYRRGKCVKIIGHNKKAFSVILAMSGYTKNVPCFAIMNLTK